jgi:hypothetical protein
MNETQVWGKGGMIMTTTDILRENLPQCHVVHLKYDLADLNVRMPILSHVPISQHLNHDCD